PETPLDVPSYKVNCSAHLDQSADSACPKQPSLVADQWGFFSTAGLPTFPPNVEILCDAKSRFWPRSRLLLFPLQQSSRKISHLHTSFGSLSYPSHNFSPPKPPRIPR